MRTLADASGEDWAPCVATYATTVSPGANVLQVVTPSAGLPVAQQGAWTVGISGTPSVSVSGTPTVAVSGTVPVSGTFFQGTQPVSIASSVTVTQATASSLNATVVGTGTFLTQAAQSGTWNVGITGTPTVAVSGTVPVSGTFFQGTQPVSLASAVTVAQATAASLNATVVGTGTFAVQASQSGTWNVGTITTLPALPAGANVIGQVVEIPAIGAAMNGTTAVTPQYATFSTSASGVTSVVGASASKKIYVLRWSVSSNGATNVNLQSHTTTGNATGLRYLTQFASGGGAYCPCGIMATASGEGLDVNNSAAVAISGEVTFVQF